MADHVEQIKSRLDVVEVVSGYLKLQKSGINFKARCPFHNEKTPSFYVTPERQIWHCFGCSKGGDMFGFVQEIEGIGFPEALRILANKAGIELKKFDPKIRDEKTRLYEICDLASKFFEKQLPNSSLGKKAFQYLADRGLKEETIKQFRIGFAPDDWHSLGKFLSECGYSEKEMISAGMAVSKNGRSYDRFRSRITFPITDLNGQVVGFTARTFSPEEGLKNDTGETPDVGAKYINTPQTLIYDKSMVLYGLSHARGEVKTNDRCLVVEGNMDVIMSSQAGARNVVATSGTALTPQQLRLLQRYSTNLDFCFDDDQAGAMATRRGIGLALSSNFNINIVQIDDAECKDPADYVKKHEKGWADLVAKSKPVIDFYFSKARETYDPLSAESKKSVIASLAPLIKRLNSRVEQAHWMSQLANFLRVKEDAVSADIESAKDDIGIYERYQNVVSRTSAKGKEPVVPKNAESDVLNEAFLSIIMKNPTLFKEDVKTINCDILDSQVAHFVGLLAQDDFAADDFNELMRNLREEYGSYKFEFAHLKSQELWKDFSDEQLQSEFKKILSYIKKRNINSKLNNIQFEINNAVNNKDSIRRDALIRQASALINERAELDRVLA
jgi:DNA primase